MRDSFAIGQCRPFGYTRLTATASPTQSPLSCNPHKATPLPKQERPALPEDQSVHARDGVADPQGCGNPLRSGSAGLSTAPLSQPPAPAPLPPLSCNPLNATPLPEQERPALPEEQSVHARDDVADPPGCGNPLRSGSAGLSAAPLSQQPTPAPLPLCPATHTKRHHNPNKKGLHCPKSKASTPGMAWPIRRDAGFLCDRAVRVFRRLPTCRYRCDRAVQAFRRLLTDSHLLPNPIKKRQAGFPLTCRFCNEPQLTSDKLFFVFSRVVFVFCIRFRCNLFIVDLCFWRDIILAFRYATVD